MFVKSCGSSGHTCVLGNQHTMVPRTQKRLNNF
uniref:Uncharacterized protein n=1 Tax=Anguilla anguilla TaxID=7936 RepID=A0A0E9VQ16_ANGAN